MQVSIAQWRRNATVVAAVGFLWACGDETSDFVRGTCSRGRIESAIEQGGIDAARAVRHAPFFSVFRNDHLPEFELSLSKLALEAIRRYPFEYQPAVFRYRPSDDPGGEVVIENVGVRLKGRGSFRDIDTKPGLKVRFDEYTERQSFLGLRRLTLNNLVQDASMMHERLAYHIFRGAGLPAPLCNSARVYINGDYYGLYANVQTLDDVFIETMYGAPVGDLYDTKNEVSFTDLIMSHKGSFELETNVEESDSSDLVRLLLAANETRGSFFENMESVTSLDEILSVGGVQAIIADWDGYFGARNNYKLYHERSQDCFIMLPWGTDSTFNYVDYRLDGTQSDRTNGLLFQRCKQEDRCWRHYLRLVARAIERWDATALVAELDAYYAQIVRSVREDRRKPYSDREFETAVESLHGFVQQRRSRVVQQLRDFGCVLE